ncbi:hypothetical protein MHAE_13108 [Mycobacterium haemophilum DSM 44634]|uniref:DUF7159 family protein n=1 Tax=Mycobacterium haemophilum TaxID=29311 RepID=UPI000655DBF2|nr:hypothetical protein [Mycobacterium haemophilum]AKN15418.1 hypothetical protein B586_00780 [Mycobacterium haemophilum DSM 44634]MCV7342299.1 hypothetical protein [Mycobacterium haemophilum DSM 44634]
MDIVLGVSMAPTAVRLLLIEGENADGVTVEQDTFQLAAGADSATSGVADRVLAAIVGTRQGASEGGHRLTSTGVTWTDPGELAALRDELAARDVGSVMLVSPLLAAAALAQTVGAAIGYQHIATLFVEPDNATLAVVDVADGSIVDLHRQPLKNAHQARDGPCPGAVAAELMAMVAGLDAPGSRADGVFIIGCGADIVAIKPGLEAATSLDISAPEEPEMALARGAALASANAPLFAASTAALAYALDPGTGEVNPRVLSPTYLDVCAPADLGDNVLAYSALDDDDQTVQRRGPLVLAGSAMAGIAALVAGLVVVSLSSDVRSVTAQRPSPRIGVVTPATQVPPSLPQAQLPAPSSAPASPPPPQLAAPPSPPPVVQWTPPTMVNMVPATPRRVPSRRAPESVPQTPLPAAPVTTPPAAVPAPPPPPVETQPPTPIMTMYLHVPFVTIPIPIYPPAPPPPPPPPEPAP